ncbi:site-specific integrase [Pseudonocardia sp. N23]|uniref:tyrosine-type recombinase/integrase n=1 Tax=Pseudonocardia sp. N23 TaxID=1987376 RepID=UPI000BFE5807|nr:site-specific integrase [Pseudonocardia sp. N23]GAY11775.1 mobile element protein [Pseudonocardia sp. N23]
MGHVQDRWWKEVGKDERGRPVREKTSGHGKGMRYRVRYIDPDNKERSKSFADGNKRAAENWLVEVENDKNKGSYLDPTAGRVTFKAFADSWLSAQTFDESTRSAVETRLRVHVYPYFGDRELRAIGPSVVQSWVRQLQQRGLAETYRRTIFANVSGVFTAAIDDERLRRNPCAAKSVTRPRGEYPKITPWETEKVARVRHEIGERYRLLVSIGAGCGLRQGEAFGLSPDDIDLEAKMIRVVRQVKLLNGKFVFAPPKHGRVRDVPLPSSVAAAIREHLKTYKPVAFTLPWRDLTGKATTVPLLTWTRERGTLNRNSFNHHVWKPALRAAGVANPQRSDGFHALRHFYASVLLDGGESIKALSEYLGHADPGFTLRTYTHLMPSSAERTRRAVDAVLGANAEGPASPLVGGETGPPEALTA